LDDRTLSDKNLFLRIAQDDERAFNELFHVYTRELYPFAMKLTGSEKDAEEILQEVFLKIWAKRKELTGIDNPKAWIIRVVSNQSLNHLRKMAVEGRFFQYVKHAQQHTSLSTEEITAARETAAIIQQAIDQLPPACRQIYLLSREENLSIKEIAEKLNLSPNTVKNQIVTALQRIRASLGSATLLWLLFWLDRH